MALRVLIFAASPVTSAMIGADPIEVRQFPFRIGRYEPDALGQNDMTILDHRPFVVSRSHCALAVLDGRCVVIDRGSRLGTLVNGTPIGGSAGKGAADLNTGDNELLIGGARSPYGFRVVVE